MSNGIGRKRIMGISVEGTYGTAVASPTFILPLLDTPRIEIVQNKVRNTSALGSSYNADSIVNTQRMANINLNVKINEDVLPLFFKQKFTIGTTTITGESAVYEHTLTYSNTNVGSSFTLWLEDDDRTGVQCTGVKFSNLNLIADSTGQVRLEATGMGKFPTTWTGNNVVTAPVEFVGRNATFNYGDYSGAKSAYGQQAITLNHTFGLSGDDVNFNLGSEDISQLYTTSDDFSCEVSALFPDFSDRDDYTNNTKKKWDLTITDTGRYITGSVTNINPLIQFDYPVGYVETWTEDGGLEDIMKQTLTLIPVDEVGVSTAPLQIVVRNKTASY